MRSLFRTTYVLPTMNNTEFSAERFPSLKLSADQRTDLDLTTDELTALLAEATAMITRRYASLPDADAFNAHSVDTIIDYFNEPLPESPEAIDHLFERVEKQLFDTATLNIAPKMFAYVMAGGNHVSMVADLLTSAINQNGAKWHLAPAMTEIEKRVIQWTADFIHLPGHQAGAMVTSGSSANLAGLNIAKNRHFAAQNIRENGWFGMKPAIVYTSVETHNSVTKSIEFLGIGRNNLRMIPVDHSLRMDLNALTQTIEQDIADGYQPFCVIANAGTVNSGAIDPMDAMADIAEQYSLWFHVDGAYGALAASVAELAPLYKGMERADSVALDFHKWLYQPYEVGCVLVKNWDILQTSYYTPASYLTMGGKDADRFNVNEHHFDLSRNGKAFKIWLSLKAYGAGAFRQMIAKDVALAKQLADMIRQDATLELISHHPLGICCFRYCPAGLDDDVAINDFNKQLIPALEQDGRIFITGTTIYNKFVIRACLINHRLQLENIQYLLTVIKDVAQSKQD